MGSFVSGVTVYNPERLNGENNVVVLITSVFANEISEQLHGYGVYNIWSLYTMRYSRFAEKNKSKIVEVLSLFADKQSVDVFKTVIEYKKSLNFDLIHNIYTDNQYFQKDILTFTDKEVFVDAGAFTGDTISYFKESVENKFRRIYAFEPDSSNFSALEQNVRDYDNIVTYKKGLYDVETKIGFMGSAKGSSRIDNNFAFQIETCRLDDIINEEVTFIKVDIEGAELKAMEGAKDTILKYKPKLAICVYHKHDDLWNIPLAVNSLVPEYKLYLRHHSKWVNCLETVLYATK